MENLDTPSKLRGIASRPALVCFFLVLIAVAVYWRVTGFDFVNYDDPTYISENPHVQRGLTPSSVGWAFRTTELSSWYPLTWMSFLLDVSLFGTSAVGPHFTNILLHAANAALLFLLLRMLTGAQWRSALVAGLFVLHPLHVESVAWVAERKDVLSTFFGLLALLMYAGYVRGGKLRRRYYLLTLLFFVLAMLSKPMLVTLPFIMLLLDYWPMKRSRWHAFGVLLREKMPFFALAVIFGVITVAVHQNTDVLVSLSDVPLAARIQNALVSYARYLGKAIWPVDLIVPYPYHGTWPPVVTLLAALLFCGLSFMSVSVGRRRPFVLVGWTWFVVTLLPVIGIITWGSQSMAYRFTYFPLVGLFIIVVWAGNEMLCSVNTPEIITGGIAAMLLVACAGRTVDQLSYWRDSETLFRHALSVDADNSVAYYGLGSHLVDTGRVDEGIQNFQLALKISRNSPEMLHSLGKAWAKKGNYSEAVSFYKQAVALKPRFAEAHCSFGNALVELKQFEQAGNEFNESLRLDPDQSEAYCGLGNLSADEGKPDEAMAYYRKALEINSADAVAHCGMGNLFSQMSRWADAVNEYQMALRFKPHFVEAENNLGTVMLRTGHVEEAMQYFRVVLDDEPNHLGAHVNLGNALMTLGKMNDAATEFSEAVTLNTNSLPAQFGLGVVSAQLGRRTDAVAHLTEALRLKPDLAAARQLLEKLNTNSGQ